MSEWRIIGQVRESGRSEEIYGGDDYCCVSDMMHNDGEPDSRYSRMELYRDGRLDEVAHCLPARGFDWSGLIMLLLVVLIVLYFVMR